MGPTHAASGLAVGAAVLPLAPVTGIAGQVAWVVAWGGFALLPDLDQGGLHWRRAMPRLTGSTVARTWGPVTTTAASVVGFLARGHRQGTHDVVIAPIVFSLLAVAASLNPVGAVVVLALAIGLALQALHVVVPLAPVATVIGNLIVSFGGAWWLTHSGVLAYGWLPWAVAGGVLVHIAGDALTVGGVPVPLSWIDGRSRRLSLRLFRTGAPVEGWLVGLFSAAALVLLAVHTGLAERSTALLASLS